jgi:hypothetical protein
MGDERGVVVPYRGGQITAETKEAAEEFIAELDRGAEVYRKTKERWPGTNDLQMARLAHLFPSMRGVPGASPWNALWLIEWLSSPAPTSGSAAAARFLLGVWNGGDGLKKRFDLFEAWSSWDDAHRKAALQWLELPFWP